MEETIASKMYTTECIFKPLKCEPADVKQTSNMDLLEESTNEKLSNAFKTEETIVDKVYTYEYVKEERVIKTLNCEPVDINKVLDMDPLEDSPNEELSDTLQFDEALAAAPVRIEPKRVSPNGKDKLLEKVIHLGDSNETNNLSFWLCGVCHVQYVSIAAFQKHIYIEHNNEKLAYFRCNVCDRPYGSYNGLREHRKTHGSKDFACPLCDYAAYSKGILNKHKRNVHGHDPPEKSVKSDSRNNFPTIIRGGNEVHCKEISDELCNKQSLQKAIKKTKLSCKEGQSDIAEIKKGSLWLCAVCHVEYSSRPTFDVHISAYLLQGSYYLRVIIIA